MFKFWIPDTPAWYAKKSYEAEIYEVLKQN
jgi:hypothetical protein